jgi:hypothetical protein
LGAVAYAMGYFRSHERRTRQLRVRTTPSIETGLERLADVWTHVERARTGDLELVVTTSDVANRLLELGIEGAWAEIGHEPKSEVEVEEVKRRAEKALADGPNPAVSSARKK